MNHWKAGIGYYFSLGVLALCLSGIATFFWAQLLKNTGSGQLTTRKTYLALLAFSLFFRSAFFFLQPFTRPSEGVLPVTDDAVWVSCSLFSNFLFVFAFIYLLIAWLEFYLIITRRNFINFLGQLTLSGTIKLCTAIVYTLMALLIMIACLVVSHDRPLLLTVVQGVAIYFEICLFLVSLGFFFVGIVTIRAIRYFDPGLLRSSVEMTRVIGILGFIIAVCFAFKAAVLVEGIITLPVRFLAPYFADDKPLWVQFVFYLIFELGLSAFILFLMKNVPRVRATIPNPSGTQVGTYAHQYAYGTSDGPSTDTVLPHNMSTDILMFSSEHFFSTSDKINLHLSNVNQST